LDNNDKQECTNFPKPRDHLKILGAKKKWQEATSLLRRHRTTFSRQTDVAPGICAHLINATTNKSPPSIRRQSDTWRRPFFYPLPTVQSALQSC